MQGYKNILRNKISVIVLAACSLIFLSIISPETSLASVTVSVMPTSETVLPNSSWSVYSNVDGSGDTSVTWQATCGTFVNSSGFTTWTAPTTTGTCIVTATSNADQTQSASSTFTIVNATIRLSNIPMQATIYKDQSLDIQSILWGNTNNAVTWSFSGGTLNASAREAVFNATVPGTYTVTSTSVADNTKTATSTIVVTDDEWPNVATSNKTMHIDCVAVGAGKTYEVSSETTMDEVPWPILGPGDTVRIHPGTYHRQILISTSGTPSQPIRICGVPDSSGNLPEISGTGAVATPGSKFGTGANSIQNISGGITIYNLGGAYYGGANYPSNIIIEGLKIDGFNKNNSFTNINTSSATNYDKFAACIRIQHGGNITLRGNEIAWCGNGIFALSNNGVESQVTRNLLVEGNYFHDNGVVGDGSEHQSYLQVFGLVVQGNYYDYPLLGGTGVQIKTRTSQQFIRYNYFEPTPYAILDFPFIDSDSSFVYPWVGLDSGELANTNPNDIVANYESYQDRFVYGNIFHNIDGPQSTPYYLFSDTDDFYQNPGRTMYVYYNTFYQSLTRSATTPHWANFFLDFGPYNMPTTELAVFPTARVTNNALYLDQSSVAPSFFMWNSNMADRVVLDRNWISSGWGTGIPGTGDPSGGYGSGISNHLVPANDVWQYGNLESWVSGVGNLLSDSTLPFDKITYLPTNGSPLINAVVQLPDKSALLPPLMQYNPASFLMSPRATINDIGAVGYSTTPLAPDTTAPKVPTDVSATAISPFQVNLSWSASTDVYAPTQIITGLSGYNVYRNNALIATSASTSFSDMGLTPNTTYTYSISALDAAGNESAQSADSVRTGVVNGACGSANAELFVNKPTGYLCSMGSASLVSDPSNGSWNWSCTGTTGGTVTTCAATVATAANTGSISGKVSAGNVGIPGVTVNIMNPANGAVVTSVTTGATGIYTASLLTPGSYKVKFLGNTAGYVPAWYNGASYNTGIAGASPIIISAGITTAGINASLVSGGAITGTVTNGINGIPGVSVMVSDSNYALIGTTTTDSAGSYTFGGIPTGLVKVRFEGNGTGYVTKWYNNKSYTAGISAADLVAVTAGTTTTGISATLTLGGSIAGIVSNGLNGVQGAYITVYDDNGAYVTTGQTAANGTYTVTGIPTGNMKLQFSGGVGYGTQWYNNQVSLSAANKVPVTAGTTTQGINAALGVSTKNVTGNITLGNGTIVCNSLVISSSSSTCTLTPYNGWYISALTDNGADVLSAIVLNKYTIASVTTDHTIAVTFQEYFVRLMTGSTPSFYLNIADALAAATTGDSIQLLDMSYPGDVTFNQSAAIRVQGGYQSGFGSSSGFTVLSGKVTINGGKVMVQKVKVK